MISGERPFRLFELKCKIKPVTVFAASGRG